jgi:phage terminase large subunit-like protein
VPRAATSTGLEAVELAASAGLYLDPWQRDAVIDLLGEDDGGFWAATSGGLICPRQNGKGSVIEALELAWLFLCDVELIFHSAHLFATASDAFRRIKSLIVNTPDLHRQVLRYSESHGQEGIELRSGQRLRFVARSKSGGRGFPAPVVVLDEAFNLSSPALAAMVPTMAAQPNPFLLWTSSAPIEDPCSDELRRFMRRSRTGEVERRCYIEYSADPDAPIDQQLQQANPGYGIRLNDDVIDEEKELLTPEAFLVERLGIVDLETDVHSVIGAEVWRACLDPAHRAAARVVYALDVAPGGRFASVAVSDGRHVEIVKYGAGTGWVVDACVAKKDILGELVLDPAGPAGALIAELESAGVRVRQVSTRDAMQACGMFLTAVVDGTLRHIGQPELDVAVANTARRDVGDGGWLWSRLRSSVDISPLVAVTLALWGHSTIPATKPVFAY